MLIREEGEKSIEADPSLFVAAAPRSLMGFVLAASFPRLPALCAARTCVPSRVGLSVSAEERMWVWCGGTTARTVSSVTTCKGANYRTRVADTIIGRLFRCFPCVLLLSRT